MKQAKPWLGEMLFALSAILIIIMHLDHLTGMTYWNMVPILIFGALWVFAKKREKIARYSVAIGSTLGMLMLLYSNLVLLLDRRESAADITEIGLLYAYVPLFSLITGVLSWLAVFIVLKIKRERKEF